MKHHTSSSQGFTAVELLVTIIVATIFTIVIYSLFIEINRSSALARNRATASDIAYANMRRYASAGVTPNAWSPAFTCSTASGSSNNNDSFRSSGTATGSQLTGGTLDATQVDLPAPVTYSVKALAIFGCRAADGNDRKPIRVESTVTFGPNNTVVKHATLVGY